MDLVCPWFIKFLRVRTRLILTRPEGDIVEYALWFEFSATNNEVEYEASIVGLRTTKEVGAQHLTTFNDS